MTVGDIGGVSWWVPILVFALGLFFVAIFMAKKDSILRCMSYTLILVILFVYLLWFQLIPELRSWHNLMPADCLITGPAQLVSYPLRKGSLEVMHVPVNVSHIECHGQIGLAPDMDNTEGANNNFDPRKDYGMCVTGPSFHNGSIVYVTLENWKFLAPEEQEDVMKRYKEGLAYFCWVDTVNPTYATFKNRQHWTAIFYPLFCIPLILFLCWSAGSFNLFGACFNLVLCDPWFLRIDATTPAKDLRAMRGDYDII
eukprot:CAMPEP_0196729414 /NCGR_PEP_ID=MMETSP1091-20130531/9813_1 /TAXON_ID=302021 /ORGANISM="Rhodomonas sp., Strain CCMP768" /LENGTH=254 /DNA_ID=CAMNT_0042072297 /DNA_START=181 /DNA_END=945 /DNA_ORIENTATION=-